MRPFIRFFVLLSLPTLVGCNLGSLNNVSGVVKYRGKPAPNFMLTFVPATGRPGKAITDDNGRFSNITAERGQTGLLTGEYEVVLKWIPPDSAVTPTTPNPAPPPEWESLIRRYGNFEKPDIKVTITAGQRTLDLDLE